jgi:hypothetical protein
MKIDRDKLVDHINSKRADLIKQANDSPHQDARLILLAQHNILQQLGRELFADPEKFK